MWGILCLIPLCFPAFRKMAKNVLFTVATTILSRYHQVNELMSSAKRAVCIGWKCSTWVIGRIWARDTQTVKDLLLLEIRSSAIKKLELGHLKVHPSKYVLTYYQGARRFQVYFPKKRGPRKIISVHTQDGKTITEEVFEAMGPSHNFHGVPTTPELLGYPGGLKITYRNEHTIHCLKTDVIKTHL